MEGTLCAQLSCHVISRSQCVWFSIASVLHSRSAHSHEHHTQSHRKTQIHSDRHMHTVTHTERINVQTIHNTCSHRRSRSHINLIAVAIGLVTGCLNSWLLLTCKAQNTCTKTIQCLLVCCVISIKSIEGIRTLNHIAFIFKVKA